MNLTNQMVITKRPVRIKAPQEMNVWIDNRKTNIERVMKSLGIKKPLTKMEAMRIIAKTDGVDLPEFIIKELRKKR